jgi:hypothetical protein
MTYLGHSPPSTTPLRKAYSITSSARASAACGTSLRCPACKMDHNWSRVDAWVENEGYAGGHKNK